MRNNIIRCIGFMLILILLLISFKQVYKFKYGDGIYPLSVFYENDMEIDVIALGSSHTFEDINVPLLWDEYGIACYNLCGSVQPMWNTYYYLNEALKYQEPDLIILDVYRIIEENEYIDSSRIIKNNYGLKFSLDKIDAVKISSDPEEWISYILEFPTYHTRYTEITYADFEDNLGIANWDAYKGFGNNLATKTIQKIDVSSVEESSPIQEKTLEYFYKIIELCEEENIPLLLIKTPYQISESDQMKYNTVAEIAEECNLPFINYNLMYDELALDFETDFADASHLNYIGNVKLTQSLGEYVVTNYDIPDRRGVEGYESYDIITQDWKQKLKALEIQQETEFYSYIDKLKDEDYTIVCIMDYNDNFAGDLSTMKQYLCDSLQISLPVNNTKVGFVIDNGSIKYISQSEDFYLEYFEISGDKFTLSKESYSEKATITYNLTEYNLTAYGTTILVYDNFTQKLVDVVGFDWSLGIDAYR